MTSYGPHGIYLIYGTLGTEKYLCKLSDPAIGKAEIICCYLMAAVSKNARIHTNQKKMEIFFSLQTV